MTSLDAFSGQFKIHDNGADVTVGNGATYNVEFQEGCSVTIDASSGEYRVTSVLNDNANATFHAFYNGYDIYKTFPISKARAVDGVSKYIELSTSHHFFAYDPNSHVIPQTATLSLTRHNVTAPAQWRIKRLDNSILAEGDAAALQASGLITGYSSNDAVSIAATLFDQICRSKGISALVIEAIVPNGEQQCADRVTLYQLLQRARVTWDNVANPGGTKPHDGADVTLDVIENARFELAKAQDRIAVESRPRFDPIFWTCNFPNTMMASVRTPAANAIQLDAVFHERGHLAGLIWESEDGLDHATTAYDTNKDYRGCVLAFDYQLIGDVRQVDEINGVTLTIEGRNANGSPMTAYVMLYHCRTSGDGRAGHCVLNFDDLPGGFGGNDKVYAGDIDRMFLSFVPDNFEEGSAERLVAPIEGSMILTNIAASGSNSTLTCGLGPGGVHRLRMANGYDDTYNVAPARIVRNCELLGYQGEFNHYVGMSHYFSWAWDGSESRYVAQDIASPLNTPCRLWHEDLAQRLKSAEMTFILSLSYEMLNSFAPSAWRQRDSDGLPALTGWEPPSSLMSPCNAEAMGYLQKVAKQFASIAADAGLEVHFQVGEPWYWVDFRTYKPYFYDQATTEAFTAGTGLVAPVIESMTGDMDAPQLAYLDWLGEQLAASILALLNSVRAEHPSMRSYALLYLPQLLNEQTPETHRVNMPPALAYPALDVLQVEDYDFVIENRADLSATGRARIEATLGYPRSAQHYLAGFALYKDTGPIWRYSTNAAAAAYEWGVDPVFIWAYTQVMRDSYVPKIRSAPAALINDLKDVALTLPAAPNDVLTFEPSQQVWKPGKPWLSDLPDPASKTFTNLNDVPDSYMGHGLEFPRIKADGSGLEFAPINQVPNGGSSGQILQKFSSADGATAWSDLTAGVVGCVPVGSITATDIQLAISQLDAQKQGLLTTPAAQLPSLNSPWINYGGGYLGVQYYKTAEGIVVIEGLVQAPGGSSTSGVVLFTLLPGFRPSGTLMFGPWSGGGSCRIDVTASGDVIIQSGNTAFTSLSGISFIAA